MSCPSTAPAAGLASILPDHPAGSLALAAAVAASAQPASPTPAGDTLLLALGAEMDRREVALAPMRARHTADEAEQISPVVREAYWTAQDAQEAFIETRIAQLRAMTPAGTAVKARALAYLYHPESFLRDHLENTSAESLIRSLAEDFAPIAARTPTPHPDEALLDLGIGWTMLVDPWRNFDADAPAGETDAENDVRLSRMVEAERRIAVAVANIPARTFAGLAIKARVLIRGASDEAFPIDGGEVTDTATALMHNGGGLDRIIGSLVADLMRLAREPRQ